MYCRISKKHAFTVKYKAKKNKNKVILINLEL